MERELQLTLEARLKSAQEMHQKGQLAAAYSAYHELLRLNPKHFQLNQQLGTLEIQVGDYPNAIEHLSRAVLANPQSWGVMSNLGLAYMRSGNLEKAQENFQLALALKPDNLQILINVAQVQQQRADLESAEKTWKKLLKLYGGNTKVLEQAGNFFSIRGQWGQAIDLYKKLLQLEPLSWGGFTGLGNCYRAQGLATQAYRTFSKAVEIAPNNPASHSNLGLMQWERGDAEAAAQSFKNALAINENFLPALHNLADYYEKANQLESALTCCEKVLNINPNVAATLRIKGTIQRREKQLDLARQTLERALAVAADGETKADIYSELGKVLDKQEKYAEAFLAFENANKLQEKMFDPTGERRQTFRNLLLQYQGYQWPSEELNPEERHALAECTPTPVFVVGFPRSGTTLLNQMLDGHEQLEVLEEKPLIDHIVKTVSLDQSQLVGGINQLSLQQKIELRQSYFKLAGKYAKESLDKITLVDKFPLNLIHLPIINALFPEAKIVVCYRHSMDSLLSNFQQKYRLNEAVANFLTLDDAATVYADVMGLWLRAEKNLSASTHVLRYEDLVADAEKELKELVSFLEMPWQPEMLEYTSRAKDKQQINTPSYQAVTENIYTSSMERWKNYSAELAPVVSRLQPIMKLLSYSAD